jgi:hypothetical protein
VAGDWGIRLGLLAGGFLVALALCEIVLRLLSALVPSAMLEQFSTVAPGLRDSREALGRLHLPDPELGYRMHASTRHEIRLRRDLPVTRITTNELGFRGPPPRSSSVVVVGDSFAFGYGVDDDETSASELGRMLGASVASLGMSGYNPSQYNRALYEYGLPNRPALVLYYLFLGNDISGHQVLDDEPETLLGDPRVGLHDLLSAKSMVYQLVKTFLNASVYRHARHLRSEALDLYLYLDNSAYDLKRRPISDNFEIVAENLKRARSRCGLAGAEMVLVLVPTKESVYRDLARPYLPSPDFFEAEDELRTRVVSRFAAEGGRSLDLAPFLQRRAIRGEQLYHVFDGHWNAAGNRAAAEEIRDYLAREELLPPLLADRRRVAE